MSKRWCQQQGVKSVLISAIERRQWIKVYCRRKGGVCVCGGGGGGGGSVHYPGVLKNVAMLFRVSIP